MEVNKMTDLDFPIVTPRKVLENRGIQERIYEADTAIICFRGRKASNQLIERFDGKPTKKRVLYHPQLYYSLEFNLFIVPELIRESISFSVGMNGKPFSLVYFG